MKSIQLTEEHKTKLLEMCKVLFPKDKVDYIEKGVIYFLINYFERPDPNNSKITFGGWDKTESIYWFEFCTITLWNELYLKLGNLELKSYYELLLNNLIHPIDYLYDEFKKLK